MTPEATEKEPGNMKRIPRVVILVLIGLAVVILTSVGVAVFLTSTPSFFSRYSGLTRNYDSLQTSAHKDLACNDCHKGKGGPVVYEAGLVGDFYRSLFGKPKEPTFTTFSKPTRDACLECHLDAWSWNAKRTTKVPHPAHMRASTEKRDCVTCHKWTAHEEAYQEKHKTMPFSGVCVSYGCHVGFKPAESCPQCHHSLQPSTVVWKTAHPKAVEEIGANACLESCHDATQCRLCHTTGKMPVFTGLATQTGLKAIEVLHAKSDWLEQHGTQALLDQSKCLTCHVSVGECQDCHAKRPAFHGAQSTWLSAHKELAKDERRCLACHKKPWCDECHAQFKEMR